MVRNLWPMSHSWPAKGPIWHMRPFPQNHAHLSISWHHWVQFNLVGCCFDSPFLPEPNREQYETLWSAAGKRGSSVLLLLLHILYKKCASEPDPSLQANTDRWEGPENCLCRLCPFWLRSHPFGVRSCLISWHARSNGEMGHAAPVHSISRLPSCKRVNIIGRHLLLFAGATFTLV